MRIVNTIYELSNDNDVIENLQFYDCYDDGNFLFFSAQERNGLFKFDKKRGTTEFLAWFENELKWQRNMHRKVIFVNNKLFFLPHYGHCIHIVNYNSLAQRYVEIVRERDSVVHFSNAFLIKDYIWIIPSFMNHSVIKINIFTEKVEEDFKFINYLENKKLVINGENFLDIYCSDFWNNQLMFAFLGTNVIFYWNLITNEIIMKQLPVDVSIRSILVDLDNVWMTLVDRYDVVKYDLFTYKVKTFIGKVFDGTQYPYVGIVKIKGKLLVLAGYGDESFIIDDEREELQRVEEMYPDDLVRITKNYALFTGIIENSLSETFLLPRGSNRMLVIDEHFKCTRSVCIYYVEKNNEREIFENMQLSDYFQESFLLDMEHFIYLWLNSYTNNQIIRETNVGQEIYNSFQES